MIHAFLIELDNGEKNGKNKEDLNDENNPSMKEHPAFMELNEIIATLENSIAGMTLRLSLLTHLRDDMREAVSAQKEPQKETIDKEG